MIFPDVRIFESGAAQECHGRAEFRERKSTPGWRPVTGDPPIPDGRTLPGRVVKPATPRAVLYEFECIRNRSTYVRGFLIFIYNLRRQARVRIFFLKFNTEDFIKQLRFLHRIR